MTGAAWAVDVPTIDAAVAKFGQAGVLYIVGAGWEAPADSPASGAGWSAVATGEADTLADVWRWHVTYDGSSTADLVVVVVVNDVGSLAGPWFGLTPAELAGAFHGYKRLTGVDWSHSIGRSAERLILACHPPDRGGRRLATVDMPEVAHGSTLELPYQAWDRALTTNEARQAFVHTYDANAQYLGAWIGVELGVGAAHHHTALEFDYRRVGFWRIPKIASIRNIHPLLPAAWLPDREWFTTVTVRRLLETTDGLELPRPLVSEAWTWPEKSRYLRGPGERLRDARRGAMDQIDAAGTELSNIVESTDIDGVLHRQVRAGTLLDVVKDLYRVQTGRFGMGGAAGPFARPDWGHTIRATARTNLHRKLYQLGAAPFAIQTDGLLFTSDEPDAAAFAARIRLPLGRGLGQYRATGTLPMADLPEKHLSAFDLI